MNAHIPDTCLTLTTPSCPLTAYLQCLEELCHSSEHFATQLFELQSYVATDIWTASARLCLGADAQQSLFSQPYYFLKGLEAHACYIGCRTRHSLHEAGERTKATVLSTGDDMARGLDHWLIDCWAGPWRAR